MDVYKSLKLQLCVPFFFFFFFYSFSLLVSEGQLLPIVDEQGSGLKTYIVHVRKPEGMEFLGSQELRQWHQSFLPNTTLHSGEPRLIYSYRHVLSGFAAKLTPAEVRAMEAMDGFLYARPDATRQIETTYTPKFLGLSQPNNGVWELANKGEGIVIGVIDTGITPSHPSFDDQGMQPKPQKFKGTCTKASKVTCNKKIIGARGFNGGRDDDVNDVAGHGTHVASIAAGNFVNHANVLDMAKGDASGMAPRAHLAIYKVCFGGCSDSDILGAIDQAITDGVDVINMSLSGGSSYYRDGVQQGSLHAWRHNISVVCSAGNSGPDNTTLTKDIPWALVVGATSTDRRIRAIVRLGNGTELAGESAYQPNSFDSSIMLPIAYPGETDNKAAFCLKGSLDFFDVAGKIVLCWIGNSENVDKGKVVRDAGGAAMILMNLERLGYTTSAEPHVLPASHLSYEDGSKVRKYFSSAGNLATATIIFKDTVFGHRPSPAIAAFSSRGPGKLNGGVLKPDVIAPGVNILAAWPYEVGPHPTGLLTSTFNFKSGTSMASPHVAGIAALIRKKHPTWLPSAIQSAIITSANDRGRDNSDITDEYDNATAVVFATGAGLVTASRALDPGLVYEINPNVYPYYLCGLGYREYQVEIIWGERVRCQRYIDAQDLNYPSITVHLSRTATASITVSRTAKYVGGLAREHFTANIGAPQAVAVSLSTYALDFNNANEEKTFSITFTIADISKAQRLTFSNGTLEWVSSQHTVKSPIVVQWV